MKYRRKKKGLRTNPGGLFRLFLSQFFVLHITKSCNQTDLQVIIHILENKITSKLSNNSLK